MHNISSFLHPPIFPLIPPPPSTALRRFPFPLFLCPSYERKEKKDILPFPFSLSCLFLLPSSLLSPPPFLPSSSFYSILHLPLSSPSLLTLFLSSFFPSFLHPLLSKFVKATPPPPSVSSFPIHYFSPFPLSIYLPFPHPLPSTSLTNTRKNIYQAYGKWRKAVHRTGVGRNDEHKRLTVKDNKIISFSFTAKGNDLAVFHRNNHFPFPSSLLSLLASFLLFFSSSLPFYLSPLRFFLPSSLPPPTEVFNLLRSSLPPSHFPFLPLHEILFSNST